MTAQIKVRGDLYGRTFTFINGKVSSANGVNNDADISIVFRDTRSAVQLMTDPANNLKQINAMKNFVVDVEGKDDDAIWFMQTMKMLQQLRAKPVYGIPMGKDVVRYVNNTNGGPVFVYVKKGRIIRITPSNSTTRMPTPGPSRPVAKSLPPPAGER